MARVELRRMLELPRVFDVYQRLIGGPDSKRRFVEEFVRPRAGDRVLDIGCGTGALCEYIPDGVSYVGVDVDETYVEAARARFGERGEFVCSPIERYRPRDGELFDIAFAFGVFHHLDDAQVQAALDVARTALKEGGRLVLSEPCRTPQDGRFETFLKDRDRGRFIRTRDGYARLVGRTFRNVDARLVERSYRIPFTVVIVEAT